jgi:general secretion pathway protein M
MSNSALLSARGLLAPWQARWQQLATRERLLVSSAVIFLAVALTWWIGIAPALAKLKQSRELAPQLEAQLQRMRSQAQQATTLKAQRNLSQEESKRALENSIKTLGAGASLSLADSRASITLKNVSADALSQWLAQARANARLTPSELRLQKSVAAPAAATPATTATAATKTAAVSASTSASTQWDGVIVLTLPSR